MFHYSEFLNNDVQVRSWIYPNQNEMDLEIWVDGEYSQTLTVNLAIRDAWWELTEKEVVA